MNAANRLVLLTLEQEHAIDKAVAAIRAGRRLFKIGGYAGCGKTVVLSRLAALYGDAALVVTPTGRASEVLRRKGVSSAATIHSQIYISDGNLPNGSPRWILRDELKGRPRVILVDEASMVSRDVYRDLASFGVPIILIGDCGQLPPVGGGGGLMDDVDVRLQQVHRNAGPISRFAWSLRSSKGWKPSNPGDAEAVRILDEPPSDDDVLAANQIVCGSNYLRQRLNQRVRNLLGFSGNYPQPGERVVCLENCQEFRLGDGSKALSNGSQAEVLGIEEDGQGNLVLDLQLSGGERLESVPATTEGFLSTAKPKRTALRQRYEPINFAFAYAVTAHSSQGGEWDNVLVYEQTRIRWEDPIKWSYTAATRAKQCLSWWRE